MRNQDSGSRGSIKSLAFPRWRGIEHMPRCYEWAVARSEKGLIKLRRKLLSKLTGDILEIGAGTGLNLPIYGLGARVVTTELDPANVRYAAQKPVATRASLLAADAGRLPFADGSFDHLVSTLVLCSVRSQSATLAELRRVLRPNGQLHLLEHILSGNPRIDRMLHRVEQPWCWLTGGCHPNRATAATLVTEGWELVRHQEYAKGILRLVVARPTSK